MKNIALGLIFVAASSQAFADESGMFADLLLGSADQEASADGFSSSGDDLSFGLRGGFAFNDNIAVEIAYQNFGEAKDEYIDEFGDYIVDKFSTTSLSAGVKGSIPFENGFAISARAGFSMWDLDLDETDSAAPGQTFSASDDGNDLYYGIGAQMKLGEKMYIGAEYTIIEMDASFDGYSFDHEVKNLALFAGYNF